MSLTITYCRWFVDYTYNFIWHIFASLALRPPKFFGPRQKSICPSLLSPICSYSNAVLLYLYSVKGHGARSRTDAENLAGLLETISGDGKVYIQWNDTDNTVELVAFSTSQMMNLYSLLWYRDYLYIVWYWLCMFDMYDLYDIVRYWLLLFVFDLCSHPVCWLWSSLLHAACLPALRVLAKLW